MHYRMEPERHAAIFGPRDPDLDEGAPGRSRKCRVCGGWHRLEVVLPPPRRANRGEAAAFVASLEEISSAECVLWPFSLKGNGYASMGSRDQKRYVHRVACALANGPAPSSWHEAAHCCGNRSCVNPKHLRWALHKENHADRIRHGTSNAAERNGNAKLTAEAVRELRDGVISVEEVCRQLGVSRGTAKRAKNGGSWCRI